MVVRRGYLGYKLRISSNERYHILFLLRQLSPIKAQNGTGAAKHMITNMKTKK